MSVIHYSPANVEFVSYTGAYPNLCAGILTLRIHGKEYRFGYGSGMHEPFWASGGECSWVKDSVSESPWIIDTDSLPDELKPLAHEIDEVFNANIPFGCCGGCI